eukprot:TRINITY_DN29528_c0_g1_i1.p1 TRINITY_DN29528_c0_g1~~TRINITY_DN29528_c0_g1_i1.p1  ORF type:complete len:564 (-),score=203.78 TRINITY_DN29528_c0_g1_i1:2-1693(-)
MCIRDRGYSLDQPWNADLNTMVHDHIDYMLTNVKNKRATEPYWNGVGTILLQMEGLALGFNARNVIEGNKYNNITFQSIFNLNFGDEIGDFNGTVNWNRKHNISDVSSLPFELAANYRGDTDMPLIPKPKNNQHCSGLIKVVDGDIYASQVTWAGWEHFFVARQYKTYLMKTNVSMTTNGGVIASGDDWYITSNKMLVEETTNDFYDSSLYSLITAKCVSEFIRVMVANHQGTDGRSWVNLFQTENSGTYCNQWMVIDYKKVTPGKTNQTNLLPDTFWVAEQMPGNVTSGDMTHVLTEFGYWPSYNTPYFKNIFDASGFQTMVDKYGPFFTYNNTARANIFRAHQNTIVDMPSMEYMMRYNKFETDVNSIIPYCANCTPAYSPMLAIASRGDLVRNSTSDFGNLTHNYSMYFQRDAFGAADAKISNYDLTVNQFAGHLVQGPTHVDQPVFTWSQFVEGPKFKNQPGMLQRFDYSFTDLSSNTIPLQSSSPTDSDHTKAIIIGSVITACLVLVLVAVVIRAVRAGKQNEDGYEAVSYTHLRAHETPEHLVCRLLLEKKKNKHMK